jgi:hypothetical protein
MVRELGDRGRHRLNGETRGLGLEARDGNPERCEQDHRLVPGAVEVAPPMGSPSPLPQNLAWVATSLIAGLLIL